MTTPQPRTCFHFTPNGDFYALTTRNGKHFTEAELERIDDELRVHRQVIADQRQQLEVLRRQLHAATVEALHGR